ncbi:VanZ family protein [uncultured Rothia sp.]|uniref:VanZ family protein n=1 Tax=uncultured Rothia sp. TaxID=316088 RepID=UPI0032176258
MHFMVSWATPILIQAVIIWVIVAGLTLPLAAILYKRRCGFIPRRRVLILPIVLLYLVGIISFTFLPLPNPGTFQCDPSRYYPRFFPGWSIEFAFRNTAGLGVKRFVTWLFVQIYLNVLLFIPWGIIAGWVYKLTFRATLLSAFGASLLIELTQLTGIWGIYSCRYRTFDVDDLITNTLGAVIGWCIAVLIVRRCPRHLGGNGSKSAIGDRN